MNKKTLNKFLVFTTKIADLVNGVCLNKIWLYNNVCTDNGTTAIYFNKEKNAQIYSPFRPNKACRYL